MITIVKEIQECSITKPPNNILDNATKVQNDVHVPVCKNQQDFVSRVILDGRYLDTFTEEPRLTAKHLDLTIDSSLAEQLRGKNPTPIISATINLMTKEHAKKRQDALSAQPQMAGFTISIGMLIAIRIIIDKTAEPACYVNPYEDLSDDADKKL